MLETVDGWLKEHKHEYEDLGLVVSITGPRENQTKKNLVVDLQKGKIEGTIYIWETGELDTVMADFSAGVSTPSEECCQSEREDYDDASQMIEHIKRFCLQLLQWQPLGEDMDKAEIQ